MPVTPGEPTRALRWGWRLLAFAFVASCWPLLFFPPGADGYKTLWLAANHPRWSFLVDPLAAGYAYGFYFEPMWAVLHAINWQLLPWLGTAGHHVTNLAGGLLISLTLALLVHDATRSTARSLAAAALFLFSAPVWFDVGFAPMVHYPFGVWFALLSLRPAWRALVEEQRPFTAGTACLSAIAYGFAVASKEAMASTPVLVAALCYARERRLAPAVLAVFPHAVILGLLLAWRIFILGGMGGYFMQSEFVWPNLLAAGSTLFALLWGHAAVALPAALVAFWRRPHALGYAGVAYLVTAAPFVLAADMHDPAYYPYSASRMLLTWALLLLCASLPRGWRGTANSERRTGNREQRTANSEQGVGSAIADRGAGGETPANSEPGTANGERRSAGREGREPPTANSQQSTAQAALVPILLVLQFLQHGAVGAAVARFLPHDPVPARPWTEPLALISDHSMAYFFEHLLQTQPKGSLDAYQTLPSLQLDLALGRILPAEAARVGFPPFVSVPELEPLALDGIELGADARGRFHLRLPPPAAGEFWISFLHQNGRSRWVLTLPIGRRRIDLPLNYSIRTVVLSRRLHKQRPWAVHVWHSPFFVDPYPATQAHLPAHAAGY